MLAPLQALPPLNLPAANERAVQTVQVFDEEALVIANDAGRAGREMVERGKTMSQPASRPKMADSPVSDKHSPARGPFRILSVAS